MRSKFTLPALALCLVAIGSHAATAQEWTRFRGPNGSGISDATTIPAQWTDKDYNWKAPLPGIGHSSPVIWGDRIFLTSAIEDTCQRIVLCLSVADGSILWEKRYDSTPHPKHLRNSYASSTPAVDADLVYVAWSAPDEYTLAAFDHQGTEKWKKNLGPYKSQHSGGTSPIVYEDLVILGNDQDGVSSLLAFDRHTGELRWQTPRRSEFVSYATPCVLAREGQPPELIFDSGAHGVSAIDPKSGKTNWELDVFDKRTVSSPILVGGLILGTCGSGAGGNYVAAVRPGSVDGKTPPQEAWKVAEAAPYVPTPIAKGDLVFLWSDKGVASCIKASNHEVLWRERVGGNYSGSPVCVGDKLYCIAEDGQVVVLAAAAEYQLLGRSPLGEDSRSTPAVTGGRMYLRTYSHLASLGGKK
jgi:outer membrane protein assembly factor BamB